MRRSFGIAAQAAGILSVSACGPAGGGPEAPALQEESRETEGTQETKVIQETEEIQKTEEARESFGVCEEAERPEDGKNGPGGGAEAADADAMPPVRVLKDLGADRSLLSGSLLRSGDTGTRMSVYVDPGPEEDILVSSQAELYFNDYDPETDLSGYSGSLSLTLEPGKTEYTGELQMTVYEKEKDMVSRRETVAVSFEKGSLGTCVEVAGSPFEGVYLPEEAYDSGFLMERICGPAELSYVPSENLALMRNMIYAWHGRKFRDPVMDAYFKERPWYLGTVEPEAFSEEVFSSTERENIRLIREMENDPERMDRWYSGSDGTAPAPYMEILDRYPGRTSSLTGSVSGGGTILSLDLAGAEEDGEFLRAQGVISVPVTVTRSQWEALKAGEPVEVTVNELTGQKKILEISDGQTVLYEEGSDRGARTPYIGLSYNYETGLYELWQDSDDTISKPVYEGEILVVRGAVFGGEVSLGRASAVQEEMTADGGFSGVYGGNYVVHDGKGHILALYSLGD